MFEKLLFKKIEAWVLVAIILLGTACSIMFGWTVMYKANGGYRGGLIGDLALRLAQAPDPFMRLFGLGSDPIQPQIVRFSEFSGLDQLDSAFVDSGLLLVSGYSIDDNVTTAYLYDLQLNERVFEWIPPVAEINKHASASSLRHYSNQRENYRTQHPLLFDNGDLVFTSGEGPLARIDLCGNLKWVADGQFHHSIELGHNGNLFVPVIMTDTQTGTDVPLRDDGIAEITPDGDIISETPIRDLLERHGYQGLLYGTGFYENDRIHLNDIEPILDSDDYVMEGDLALSIRNLSTVLLYRPSTDEIVWLETGPWLSQHDVDYHGNGIFTIFGNDRIRGFREDRGLRGYSTIWSYDQKDGSVRPFQELNETGIYTSTQGLHTVLDNGDMFIEETDSHILHRISGSMHRWRYVNSVANDRIGALHWSRYLARGDYDWDWLDTANCT